MGNPNAGDILFVPGKLCKSPTDFSAAFPHGGTALGLTRGVKFQLRRRTFVEKSEEFGTSVAAYHTGEDPILTCTAREMDNDFLASVFHNTKAGATTGRRVVVGDLTDGGRPGQSLEDISVPIYFSPDHPLHPGIYLYRAVPMVDPAAEVNLALGTELGIFCAWLATPNASEKVFALGPHDDIASETGL